MKKQKIELHQAYHLSTFLDAASAPAKILDSNEKFSYQTNQYGKMQEWVLSATKKENKEIRFYRHFKKEKQKIGTLNFFTDEVVTIEEYICINPTIDYTNVFLYFAVLTNEGDWTLKSYPFSDIFIYNFEGNVMEKEETSSTQLFQKRYCLEVDEKEKKFSFQLVYDYSDEESFHRYIDENTEYENVYFSREKEDVMTFIQHKSHSRDERNSDIFKESLKSVQHQLEKLTSMLNEEENKKIINEVAHKVQHLLCYDKTYYESKEPK